VTKNEWMPDVTKQKLGSKKFALQRLLKNNS